MGVRGGWLEWGQQEELGPIREEGREGGLGVSRGPASSPTPPGAKVPPPHHSLANESPLGNGLQGSDPPAHLGCAVELQSHPGGGREGDIQWRDLEAPRGGERRKGSEGS